MMGGQSMMAGDTTLMAVAMVLGAVILGAALVAGLYLVLRALEGHGHAGNSSARSLLDHRLAAGEISLEEYTERCGALVTRTQGSAR